MAARRRKRVSTLYDVHGLDVWGNRREGYSVNDVYPSQGTVEIHDDATDEEIVRALKREGFIDKGIHTRSVSIDGERGYALYIGEARNYKPVYELRPRDESPAENFDGEKLSLKDRFRQSY